MDINKTHLAYILFFVYFIEKLANKKKIISPFLISHRHDSCT